MHKSPREILWILLKRRRQAIDNLIAFLKEKEKMPLEKFLAEKERLLRTLFSINAHISDAQNLKEM